MKPAIRFLQSIVISTSVLAGSTSSAFALPSVYTIRHDMGGHVIDYAIKMKRMEQDGRSVRFAGRCDSACTLFLGLPSAQTCITPAAKFGFHLPFGSSARGNKVAANFLIKTYPGWVRTWLRANGGLNNSLKTMTYQYASRFIDTCGSPGRVVTVAASY
ncbi:hypothetical protein [Pararhizobium sp.]|uniref:hypothetical protein n=1 Tax=Pararhizobium sp. TaxID=1977563 RepID=UPI0027284DC9|nr:hypothetical protein [Pararhizobium sp.]MDO9414799.1 hypothetical protein [Pararhizobium sp.]